MDSVRLIIAGGRDFDNYEYLCEAVDTALSTVKPGKKIEIISGTAKGADSLGERYAKEHGYEVVYFKPDWDTFGKRAGFMRNEDMAKYANCVICFWDGKSKGTEHMIDLAVKRKLKLIIKFYIAAK